MSQALLATAAMAEGSAAPAAAAATPAPFVVRLAGLPAAAALALRSERCRELLVAIERLEESLSSLRRQAVPALFEAVPGAPPELRRLLLAFKRKCHNGASLGSADPAQVALLPLPSGELLRRILAGEAALATLHDRLGAAYGEAREGVRLYLLELLGDDPLRRGLTLASRDLVENHRHLARSTFRDYGRKSRSAERSLTRYICRTALKLSPYSTLTPVGLGVAETPGEGHFELRGQPFGRRHLMRLKCYLPDQWCEFLLRSPAIRPRVEIALNATVENLGDGWHRFLRPWMVQWNAASGDYEYATASSVKVRLRGPLVDWLKANAGAPAPFAELARRAGAELGADPANIENVFGRFLDLGFLRALSPWPSYEPHPERRLLLFLESSELLAHAELDAVRGPLRRLVELEDGYPGAADPAASLALIEGLALEIFEAARRAVHPESRLAMEKGRQDINQDVFLHASREGKTALQRGAILRLDRGLAAGLLRSGRRIWEIRALFERRHECLHAFWHAAREKWPGAGRVPFLLFFAELDPLWKLYVENLVDPGEKLFDPFRLPAVQALGELRKRIAGGLVEALEPDGEGFRLRPEALSAIAAEIPPAYRALVGPCLFAQPADSAGETWVTHRMGDGSGRYSSRFSTLMPETMREEFLAHLTARSSLAAGETGGGPVELLDIPYSRLSSVNRHLPQTRKILELPGETLRLDESRRVTPADLVVEIGAKAGDLGLRDLAGGRYLPCFLSALHWAFIPTIVKFLSVFGIDTRGELDIAAPITRCGAVERHPRLTIERLVFRRARWVAPVAGIPGRSGDEVADFARIWRWRSAIGLPEKVYWIEPLPAVAGSVRKFKPQFVDFASPTLVSLFLFSLGELHGVDHTTFEEALPAPESFPKDADGRAWAVEATLESIAFAS